MVGLGRMGGNLVRRIASAGMPCVVFDVTPGAAASLATEAPTYITPTDSLTTLVSSLPTPRAVWVMVPAGGPTEAVIETLLGLLAPGDTLIDGGNSNYRDALRHSQAATQVGVHFVDVGTSGGVWGRERGYCLMIGGDAEAVQRLSPVWEAVAPGVAAAPRTAGRSGATAPEEHGWLHCGPSGAGHFVKMIHNGIEYGLMAAYAEGLNILHHAADGTVARTADAETAPLAEPQNYSYHLDIPAITELWRRGSVVSSWLLDLTAGALHESPTLEDFTGHVSDSGEGRWTAIAAIDTGVPAPVLTAALYSRFESRGRGQFAGRVLSAMRRQFGGHHEKGA